MESFDLQDISCRSA